MKSKDFEWLTDEFMLYCRSTQLREKTMSSYEQTLHLFGRCLADELKIFQISLNVPDGYDTIIMRHEVHILRKSVRFYQCKNAGSFLHTLWSNGNFVS